MTYLIFLSCVVCFNLHANEYYAYECGSGLQSYRDDGYANFRPWQREKIVAVILQKSRLPGENYDLRFRGYNDYGNLPYGYLDDDDDDEIRSPWSNVTIPTSGHCAGQILYDPNTAQPFRIPPYGDDYLE